GPAERGQRGDLVAPLDARHVVDLEGDALGLEVADLRLDVVDVHLGDRVPGLPGELREVDVEPGATRGLVHQLDARDLHGGRQPEFVGVEVARPVQIAGRDVRLDSAVVQHWPAPGGSVGSPAVTRAT